MSRGSAKLSKDTVLRWLAEDGPMWPSGLECRAIYDIGMRAKNVSTAIGLAIASLAHDGKIRLHPLVGWMCVSPNGRWVCGANKPKRYLEDLEREDP